MEQPQPQTPFLPTTPEVDSKGSVFVEGVEPSHSYEVSKPSASHVLHPEHDETSQEDVPHVVGRLEVAPGKEGPRKVLRPRDLVNKKMKTLIASALVAVGGASMSHEAQAGSFEDSLQNIAKVVAIGAINGRIAGSSRGVQFDTQGKPVLVVKSPAQQAVERPANIDPNTRALVASLGLSIIDQAGMFAIVSDKTQQNVPIKKVYSATHYTESIQLQQGAGGLLLSTTFVKDGQRQTQMAIISVDTQGGLKTTIISQ